MTDDNKTFIIALLGVFLVLGVAIYNKEVQVKEQNRRDNRTEKQVITEEAEIMQISFDTLCYMRHEQKYCKKIKKEN